MINYPKEILDISKRFTSLREEVGVEEVMVLSDSAALTEFVHSVYADLEERWTATHYGTELGVSQTDLFRYLITAIESRTKYVYRQEGTRPSAVRTNDLWYLPAPFAFVVNQLGVVDVEAPLMRLVPKWNSEYDQYVLSLSEFTSIGLRLRKLEEDPDAKVILIHALEKDKRGNQALMELVPLTQEGILTQVRSDNQVDSVAASVFVILGLRPTFAIAASPTTHPRALPNHYFPVAATEMIRMVMAEIRGKQAS